MPIEAHCPDPGCARVHVVKSKYAGCRARCPACRTWMYVPRIGVALLAQPAPEPVRPVPAPVRRAPVRIPALLLLLGILSLGLLLAAPNLTPPRFVATGVFADRTADVEIGTAQDHSRAVLAVPILVGGPALLALLVGLALRRFGGFSLFLVYLSAVGSAAILFLALSWLHAETMRKTAVESAVQKAIARGGQGNLSIELGHQLHVGAAGALAACLLFLIVAVCLHRRTWSRIASTVALGFLPAVSAVWIFRDELRVLEHLPF